MGTNDFTQYTLACDRNNTNMAYLYSALHPAMLHSLAHLLQMMQSHKLPISICGEIAGDMLHVPVLLGLGYKTLSMQPGAFPLIVPLLQQLRYQDCVALVQHLLSMTDTNQIQQQVYQFLRQHVPQLPHWQSPFSASESQLVPPKPTLS